MIVSRFVEMQHFPFLLLSDVSNRQSIILTNFDHSKLAGVIDATPNVLAKVANLPKIKGYGDWISFVASQILVSSNFWVSGLEFE